MQYHHLYHAGNFADVFKHTVLIELITALLKKDKPFSYIDTHAGIGRYDLNSKAAQKSGEHKNGIYKLYSATNEPPDSVKKYLEIINSANKFASTSSLPSFYPGSPFIVRSLLREEDKMILCELNKSDFALLKREFAADQKVALHNRDGFVAIKSLLPPEQGRALTLIDPAFEDENEFSNIVTALKSAYERYPIGMYAIWYPIKDDLLVKSFYMQLRQLGFTDLMISEFSIKKPSEQSNALTSCGMVILNPPWQLEIKLQATLKWLCSVLQYDGQGDFKIF